MHVDKEKNEEPLEVLVKKGQQESYLKTTKKSSGTNMKDRLKQQI